MTAICIDGIRGFAVQLMSANLSIRWIDQGSRDCISDHSINEADDGFAPKQGFQKLDGILDARKMYGREQ